MDPLTSETHDKNSSSRNEFIKDAIVGGFKYILLDGDLFKDIVTLVTYILSRDPEEILTRPAIKRMAASMSSREDKLKSVKSKYDNQIEDLNHQIRVIKGRKMQQLRRLNECKRLCEQAINDHTVKILDLSSPFSNLDNINDETFSTVLQYFVGSGYEVTGAVTNSLHFDYIYREHLPSSEEKESMNLRLQELKEKINEIDEQINAIPLDKDDEAIFGRLNQIRDIKIHAFEELSSAIDQS